MNDVELVRTLARSQSAVLTAPQLASILHATPGVAAVRLNRLTRRGVLLRVLRGRYVLPDADVLAVASSVYPPSYVSLLAAFEVQGTTTQSPRVIDVVNPVRSAKIPVSLESGSYEVHYIKVPPSLIYGFGKVYRGNAVAFVADKERAIVDGLMFPGRVPLDEVAACIRDGIDPKKACEYAVRTGRQAVMKRLGHMLEAEGVPTDPDDYGVLSATYVPLDPHHPRRGRYDSRWRVTDNLGMA